MKVVILAGGFGTRLAEETEVKPKPMVEIGGRPMLWHIMKHYAQFGHKEFYVALGYKSEVIKRYFLDYSGLTGDLTVNLGNGEVRTGPRDCEDWVVHLIDTGADTLTGGRVKRLERYLGDAPFMLTYGDGVSNVDIAALTDAHSASGRLVTVTAVRPPARFGSLVFDGDLVTAFTEKPQTGEGWINGGFFVCEPGIFRFIEGDRSSLEADTLEALAAAKQLAAYRHEGFWQCMDTMRDRRLLEGLWDAGSAPWATWETPAAATVQGSSE
jgi:glucose-1-phosphate cytidylyltransferase